MTSNFDGIFLTPSLTRLMTSLCMMTSQVLLVLALGVYNDMQADNKIVYNEGLFEGFKTETRLCSRVLAKVK